MSSSFHCSLCNEKFRRQPVRRLPYRSYLYFFHANSSRQKSSDERTSKPSAPLNYRNYQKNVLRISAQLAKCLRTIQTNSPHGNTVGCRRVESPSSDRKSTRLNSSHLAISY